MRIQVRNLGLINYSQAMTLMDALHAKRVAGEIEDTLLVLEHSPVVTRGRRLADQALPMQRQLEEKGVEIHNADRGGELTYHGPGQIVVYFILKVDDHFLGVTDLVKAIEDALVRCFEKLGLKAQARKEHPGIWIDGKKVASIGLRVSQGVTKHGLAVNVRSDLSVYDLFSPCGLEGNSMTNLECVLGETISDAKASEIQNTLIFTLSNDLS